MDNSYIKFALGNEITTEQKDFFNQNGFIHFKSFIKQETVNDIIKASLGVQQQWIENERTKVNGIPIKYGKDLDGSAIVQRFAFINQHHPLFTEITYDTSTIPYLQKLRMIHALKPCSN
jgi:phytanoyl-CoA hydroxylase